MNKDTVLKALRSVQSELARFGVFHAALFGSVARGEQDEYSDVDIALYHSDGYELDPRVQLSLGGIVNEALYQAFGHEVPNDVVMMPAKTPSLRDAIEEEQALAF